MQKKNNSQTKKERGDGREFKLSLNVSMQAIEKEEMPEMLAYAFDPQNNLLEAKPLSGKKSQKTEFTLKHRIKNEKIRVIIGPKLDMEAISDKHCIAGKLPHGRKPETVIKPKLLVSKGGIEKHVRLRETRLEKNVIIPKENLVRWFICPCTVKGRLVKEMTLPEGTVKHMGVYQACIYIWEVDCWYYLLERLPDIEILRIRDDLRETIERWPPDPWPPDPDPGPYFGSLREKPFVSSPLKAMETKADKTFDFQSAVRKQKLTELDSVFSAQSAVSLRKALLELSDVLIPYLCHFPWIYGYLNKEFLTCTCTDSEGYFERTIYYPCTGDKPDLYFTAHQCIDGNWVTLYDPGMRCHVHWNYSCGSDVLLVTDEPGARVSCDDNIIPPADVYTWVEPHGIGNFTLDEIDSNDGTVNYDFHGTQIQNAPFGARLGFKMGRSNNIPNGDVFYYRIQYRQGTGGEWHESLEPVTRHYIHEEDDQITFPTVTLGPVPVKGMHLYRFKPEKPHDLDDSIDSKDQWPEETWFGSDMYAGYLDTTQFPGGVENAHGLYQVKIEVFDSAGKIVDPYDTDPVFKFIMPITSDSASEETETEVAPSAYRDGNGFIFNLAVDNRSCSAAIDLPLVDNVAQETEECGFLHYDEGDTVTIDFHASHPGNNAVASFTLKRGNSVLNEIDGTDMSFGLAEVASALYSGDYTNNNDGDFNTTVSAGALLGDCTNAAFAEDLHVYAKAHNGRHRIAWYDDRHYDAGGLRAFALSAEDSET